MTASLTTACRVGYWSALLAFLGAAGYCIAQVLQVTGLLHAPLDAELIYGCSLGIATPFLLAMLALHYITPPERQLWSHAALLGAVIYVVYVNLNYVVQLATVLPFAQHGALGGAQVLDQTPHSLFWDVDALGYIFMGLATLAGAQVFDQRGPERWVRWFFLANGWLVPVIAVVYFYPVFSYKLLLLATPWIITAPGSILLLMLHFKRQRTSLIAHP